MEKSFENYHELIKNIILEKLYFCEEYGKEPNKVFIHASHYMQLKKGILATGQGEIERNVLICHGMKVLFSDSVGFDEVICAYKK